MGRKLMRVPMDFSWPLGVAWKGYINPYCGTRCARCEGSGLSPEAKKLSDDWYGFNDPADRWSDKLTQDDVDALVKAGRLHDLTRDFSPSKGWSKVKRHPTAEQVNAWSRKGFGHDAINQSICLRARCERMGIAMACSLCEGRGEYWCDPKYAKLCDRWKRVEPPTGEGYQMWETTTEGSPKSPVFATLRELAEWCAPNVSIFGDDYVDADEWERQLGGEMVAHRVGNMIFV